MIVNPQEFNYRVTIGILVVAIVAFAAYGFSSYSTLKSDKDFLVQEKRHLHNELSEILDRYDELNSENLILKSQLDSTAYRVRISDNAIKNLQAKASLNKIAISQLQSLKTQKSSLLEREDSLIKVARQIEEEKRQVANELTHERISKNDILKERDLLANKIGKASLITANSFVAKAYKLNSSGKATQTFKAKETKQIELCFVVAENVLAPKGTKQLYVQIIDPNNNIVSDKGAVTFGNESLIFSEKADFYYSNNALDVCVNINNDESFNVGIYYVNVFENNKRLGSTQIQLK
jgi:hypothetical protein